MVYVDLQLIPNEAPCALATEQVSCLHGLLLLRLHMLQLNFDWEFRVLTIVSKADDGPRSLHVSSILMQILNEYSLD